MPAAFATANFASTAAVLLATSPEPPPKSEPKLIHGMLAPARKKPPIRFEEAGVAVGVGAAVGVGVGAGLGVGVADGVGVGAAVGDGVAGPVSDQTLTSWTHQVGA